METETRRLSRTVLSRPWAFLLVTLLSALCVACSPLQAMDPPLSPVAAEEVATASAAEASPARLDVSGRPDPDPAQAPSSVAQALGWPGTIVPCAGLPGRGACVTDTGQAEGYSLRAALGVLDSLDQPALLDQLAEQGLARGLFHGREAVIAHAGDAALSGRPYGTVTWRCGPYVFLAEDAAGQERETEAAEALYTASERANLCGLPATLVIPVESGEARGENRLAYFENLAHVANWYHELNSYGRVDLAPTIMDADGEGGAQDWYRLSPTVAHYRDWRDMAAAALELAFAGVSLPREVYVERLILVYAAGCAQLDPPDTLYGSTLWLPPDFSIAIPGPARSTEVYVSNLVLLPEDDSLGGWVHELGHTLRTRDDSGKPFARIPDRYESDRPGGRTGHVAHWDLMGLGVLGGYSPTHMCSYTKEAAGWLRYVSASYGIGYALTAVEQQKMGDAALKLDDPLSDDPRFFYIIEAREHDTFFGAPESGVVIYHVTYDEAEGHAIVDVTSTHDERGAGAESANADGHATLHLPTTHRGASEYVNEAAGFRVILVAEEGSPYRATVRIEKT